MTEAMTSARTLYMQGTYVLTCEARVTGTGVDPKYGRYVRLDQTVFHPQGGGQLSDIGRINEVAITHVSKLPLAAGHQFDVLHHYKGEEDLFVPGQEVSCVVDGERRTSAAKWHSAGHLLSAVVERLFPHVKGVNAHHFPGEARVEFTLESGEFPTKAEVEARLPTAFQEELAAAKPVIVDNHSDLRTIQYGDHRAVPCGGTHVENTSEIPSVSIRKVEIKKGKMTIGYDLTA